MGRFDILGAVSADAVSVDGDDGDGVGFDWANLGKQSFGVVHTAGKAAAGAFGFEKLAELPEKFGPTAKVLPGWAGGTKSAPAELRVAPIDPVLLEASLRADEAALQAIAAALYYTSASSPANKTGVALGKKEKKAVAEAESAARAAAAAGAALAPEQVAQRVAFLQAAEAEALSSTAQLAPMRALAAKALAVSATRNVVAVGRFDLVGAVDIGATGLKNQYVVLQVESINSDVFRKRLKDLGQSRFVAPLAMVAADHVPKEALDVVLPIAASKLEQEFGIKAKVFAANAPPPARSRSEFIPGVVVGGGLVALGVGVGWGAWRLLFRRIFS